MRTVRNARTVHRRHSVRALMVGTVVSAVGAAWASLPGAWVDQLPTWVVLAVPAAIFVLGLVGAYTPQSGLED